jgi:V8-like Glu-specific endopeptidase
MRNMIAVVGIVLQLFLLSSCGEKRAPEFNRKVPEVLESRSNPTDLKYSLKKEIDKFHATCMEEEGCLEGVGMIVASETNDYAYRCTGFLMANNIMVTSGHCIPQDLRFKNANCNGRVYLVLPGTETKEAQTLECESLISFNQEKGSLYDYAFFKLAKRTNRKPIIVNSDDRLNHQLSTIWKSNPNNKYEGRIYKTSCQLHQSAINSEFFDGPKTGVINYSGCVTRKGNSGSPVLNTTGEVIGIHQSSLKSTSDLGIVIKKYVRSRSFFASGTATNFGCLCKKNYGYTHQCSNISKSCNVNYTNTELDSRRNKLLNKAMLRFITPTERIWIKSMTSAGTTFPFDWKTTSSFRVVYDKVSGTPTDLNIYLAATPKCIRSKIDLIEESIPLSIENYNFDRSLFVSMARLCKVKFKFSKSLQFESMVLKEENCKIGRGYLDYKNEQITNDKLSLVYSYSAESYQDIGVPFPQGLKLNYCQ